MLIVQARLNGTTYWNLSKILTLCCLCCSAGKPCQLNVPNVIFVPETCGQFGDAKTVVWPSCYIEHACVPHIGVIPCIESSNGLAPISRVLSCGKLAHIHMLILHHHGELVCKALQRQQGTLEQFEQQKHAVEQEKLGHSAVAQ